MLNDYLQFFDVVEILCFVGILIFMCLLVFIDLVVLQVGLIGVFWDGGIINCVGVCYGLCEVCNLFSLMCKVYYVSCIVFYDLVWVGDFGDVLVNFIDLFDLLCCIEGFYCQVYVVGILLLLVGGDYLVILLIFCVLGCEWLLGMVYFDVYFDINDCYFGDNFYIYGMLFCRVIEEGLFDLLCMVQIGICGLVYLLDDDVFVCECGICVIYMEEFVELGVEVILVEVWWVVGDGLIYVSFDVDVFDLVFVFGIGILEIGGMISFQVQ